MSTHPDTMHNPSQANSGAKIFRRKMNSSQVLLMITVTLFVVLYVASCFLFADRNFAKFSVFFNLFNSKAYLLMLSLGLTIVMISGSIDISVGSVTGLVSMVVAVMLSDGTINALWTIPAALAIGLAFGLVQGFLISYLEIQPFIVTLTGLFFGRGLISMISSQSVPIHNEQFLSWSGAKLYIPFLYNVRRNGTLDTAYLTPAAVVALLVLIILIVVHKKTKFGRSLYAVGGSPQSALLMGVNVKAVRFSAHVLCGVLAGIGGFLFTLFAPSGNPGNGSGYEIDAISSAVIGGITFSGGVGLPIGTFFGVLINSLIERVVPLLGIVEASWPRIITSAFLFAFIVLQALLTGVGWNRPSGRAFLSKFSRSNAS